MNETIVAGIIGGFVALAVALITAWVNTRRQPSKAVFSASTLVGASGQVIGNLTAEIARLDKELEEERRASDGLRQEVERHSHRIIRLELALRAAGIEPEPI